MLDRRVFLGAGAAFLAQRGLARAAFPKKNLPALSPQDYQVYVAQFHDYQRRRGDLDELLENCRKNPDRYHPRLVAWAACIELAQTIANPKLRLMAINGFVNLLVNYDETKNDHIDQEGKKPDWIQAPLQTCVSGMGICGDYGALKYETILRAGFTNTQTKFCGVRRRKDKSKIKLNDHVVVLIDLGSNRWVLDLSGQTFDKPNSANNLEQLAGNCLTNSDTLDVVSYASYIQKEYFAFSKKSELWPYGEVWPLLACSETEITTTFSPPPISVEPNEAFDRQFSAHFLQASMHDRAVIWQIIKSALVNNIAAPKDMNQRCDLKWQKIENIFWQREDRQAMGLPHQSPPRNMQTTQPGWRGLLSPNL